MGRRRVGVALTALALLALALVFAWRLATRASRASSARNRRALAGESAAERLLQRQGFDIIERQASRQWSFDVDGE